MLSVHWDHRRASTINDFKLLMERLDTDKVATYGLGSMAALSVADAHGWLLYKPTNRKISYFSNMRAAISLTGGEP